ncbi:MAG: hypothetical protein NUV86_08115 [Candidatus Scalindua sp.]|nr:hypothetical protein [Candidatus Scalindua sp.]
MAEDQLDLIVKLAEEVLGRKLSANEKLELRAKFLSETGDPAEKAKNAIKSKFLISESTWIQKKASTDDIDRIIRDIIQGKGK